MRISIIDQEFNIENNESAVSVILDLIQKQVEESKLIVSHLTIDGTDIYEDYDEYLTNHLAHIEHVNVKLVTPKHLLNEILLSANEYLQKAIPEVKALSDEFYQGEVSKIWGKLEQLVEAIQWFQHSAHFVKQLELEGETNEVTVEVLDFSKELDGLTEAVHNQDTVLLGDILQYEILPRFEHMSGLLAKVVNEEVVIHDVN